MKGITILRGERYMSYFKNTRLMKLVMMTVLVVMMIPTPVFAHTGLEESNPKDGEIVNRDITEIVMTFESKIENLSSFELFDENNGNIEVSQIELEDHIMRGHLENPLSNGTYKVHWKVLGTDGHVIEGEFGFEVNQPADEEPELTEPEENSTVQNPENSENNQVEKDNGQENEMNQEAEKELAASEGYSPLYVILIILVIAILIFMFWRLRRRNK